MLTLTTRPIATAGRQFIGLQFDIQRCASPAYCIGNRASTKIGSEHDREKDVVSCYRFSVSV